MSTMITAREGIDRFVARKAQECVGTWKDAGPQENVRGVVHSAYCRMLEDSVRYEAYIDTFLDEERPIPYPFVKALCTYYDIDENELLFEQPPCEYQETIREAVQAERQRRADLEAEMGELMTLLGRQDISVDQFGTICGIREGLRERFYVQEDVTEVCLRIFAYGMIKGKRVDRARRSGRKAV